MTSATETMEWGGTSYPSIGITPRVVLRKCDGTIENEIDRLAAEPEIALGLFGNYRGDQFCRNGIHVLAICPHPSNPSRPIGAVSLDGNYLSYFVSAAWSGRGIATAAVSAACKVFAEAPLSHFQAHVLRSNLCSQRVLERCGFRFDGLWRRPRGLVCGEILCYTRPGRSL